MTLIDAPLRHFDNLHWEPGAAGRPIPDLVRDAGLLESRAAAAARFFGSTDIRIGASWSQFVLCSQLLKVTLGAAYVDGLRVHLDSLLGAGHERRWPVTGTPRYTPTDDPAGAVVAEILPVLDAMHETLTSFCRLPRGITDGNLAADIVALGPKVPGVDVGELLDRAGVAQWMTGERRRSCCLYYMAPSKSKCGNCAVR